jgi:hypothetical protein
MEKGGKKTITPPWRTCYEKSNAKLCLYTAKNDQVVAILMKTGLNNVVRPTLFTVVNNIVTPDSGSSILFNVVDKCEQRGPHNIVQSC